MKNEVEKEITNQVKSTIDYAETANKIIFMAGATVAIIKCEDYYSEKIKALEYQLDFYKSSYNGLYKEMQTVASILLKYSDNS